MDQEGVSLGMLANAVGVHRSFISHLVSGRSTGSSERVARLIASVLDVPTEVLFSEGRVRAGRRASVEKALHASEVSERERHR